MTHPGGSSPAEDGGWKPIPDPTALTTEAVNRATDVFRRELSALRELHDKDVASLQTLMAARMDAMDASTLHQFQQVTAGSVEHALARDKAVGSLREIMEERLGAMDRATQLLAQDLRAVPTSVDQSIVSLRELMESRLAAVEQTAVMQGKQAATFPMEVRAEISHLGSLHEEKFASIANQFSERDIRTDQASRAAKEALDAALQAAKELVGAQGEAAGAAAIKSETSFTKQIDQIGTIISTLEKALDARITELKERIDRGEGQGQGQASGVDTARFESVFAQSDQIARMAQSRAVISAVIAGIAVAVSVVTVIILLTKK